MTESPYLSLRRAVRPAIVAHRVLAGDAERAGQLAAECEDLLALTRELLTAAGLAHLLGGAAGASGASGASGAPGRPGQLRDAYAEAGMAWAKVVGSAMALAGGLLDQGDWDEVRGLARFFAEAGEEDAAAFLRAQLGKAAWEKYHIQLRKISIRMTAEDIRQAIGALRAILREVPEELPDRNSQVNRFLPPLAAAIHAIMKEKNVSIPYESRVEHIAAGGVARYPEIVTISIDELSAEFEGACG
jgi:hypothetical protein